MNYLRVYNSIIYKAKHREGPVGYYEKHHIIPKCIGGGNGKENLVNLTFREHFICHRLLCKIYPTNNKLKYALSFMVIISSTNKERENILTSRHFELVKNIYKPLQGKWNTGKPAWNKGLFGKEYKEKYQKGIGLNPPSMLGYRWVNDGLNQTKIPPNTNLPEGWAYGRLDLIGDNNPMKNKETAKKNSELRKKSYENKKSN